MEVQLYFRGKTFYKNGHVTSFGSHPLSAKHENSGTWNEVDYFCILKGFKAWVKGVF